MEWLDIGGVRVVEKCFFSGGGLFGFCLWYFESNSLGKECSLVVFRRCFFCLCLYVGVVSFIGIFFFVFVEFFWCCLVC